MFFPEKSVYIFEISCIIEKTVEIGLAVVRLGREEFLIKNGN